jgi:uncharacterized protein (TIGR00251 family)
MGQALYIRVTPQASVNQIKREEQADGSVLFKVYVTVPPEDGKANDAVIKLLAKHFGVAKSHIEIIRGHTHRNKVIMVQGIDDL